LLEQDRRLEHLVRASDGVAVYGKDRVGVRLILGHIAYISPFMEKLLQDETITYGSHSTNCQLFIHTVDHDYLTTRSTMGTDQQRSITSVNARHLPHQLVLCYMSLKHSKIQCFLARVLECLMSNDSRAVP